MPSVAKKRKKPDGLASTKEKSKKYVPKLHELYMAKSWNEMVKYLKTNKGKEDAKCMNITVRGESFQIFLHLALKRWTPVHVTRAVIEAHPDGARQRDENGRLPLHIYISGQCFWSSQGSSSVVDALLDAYPEATQQRDFDGKLPLHQACAISSCIDPKLIERILMLYPEGANQAVTFVRKFDSRLSYSRLKNFLPIHVACCTKFFSIEVIKMLASKKPQTLHKRTSKAEECELGFVPIRNCDILNNFGPIRKFENYTPFQWTFKTHLHYDSRKKYISVPEESRSVLVFVLTKTYPNICSVEQDKFYEQKARRRRNVSGNGNHKNCYSDNSFLFLHYALFCGAPLDVIQTISEVDSILTERNKDEELPMFCAIDTGNVPAAIHMKRLCKMRRRFTPLSCSERDREFHLTLTKCCPYDDRRNHLLHLMYDPKHDSDGMQQKFDHGDQQMHHPLHSYLMKMIMTPDADPRLGCGGVTTICPLVVRNFLRGCPSAVGTPLRIQRMRSGYNLLVATKPDGVSFYLFQIMCMLFSDMFISNINFSGSQDDNNAFWEATDLGYTNSVLMRQKFDKDSKVDQDKHESDIVVVDVLFKMLQLYPAAIASD